MARDIAEVVREAREREEREAPQAAPRRITTLADLQAKRVPLTITVRGMPINVECDPDAVTIKAMREVAALAQADESAVLSEVGVVADFIAKTVSAWDLREADGKTVVDLSVERLEEFGIGLLQDIMTALVEAQRMGEANGTPSKPRSSRTPTRARRRS